MQDQEVLHSRLMCDEQELLDPLYRFTGLTPGSLVLDVTKPCQVAWLSEQATEVRHIDGSTRSIVPLAITSDVTAFNPEVLNGHQFKVTGYYTLDTHDSFANLSEVIVHYDNQNFLVEKPEREVVLQAL